MDTTVYSFTSWLTGAVHEILFREGHQLASGIVVLAFQRTCGAEGPAGATLTLCNITLKALASDMYSYLDCMTSFKTKGSYSQTHMISVLYP